METTKPPQTRTALPQGAKVGITKMTLITEATPARYKINIYSQVWQEGEQFAHVIFDEPNGQTILGNFCHRGNCPEAVKHVARWTTRKTAMKRHEEYLAD